MKQWHISNVSLMLRESGIATLILKACDIPSIVGG